MDKLRALKSKIPQFDPQANEQAARVCTLLLHAHELESNSVTLTFQHGEKIHPMVFGVLIAKGYTVVEIPLVPNLDEGTTSYSIK